jgi:hypothetical protein
MSILKKLSVLAAVMAALAIGISVYQHNQTRQIEAKLAAANGDRDALIRRIGEAETRAAQAEQRAKDAERDSVELLKAIQTFKAQRTAGSTQLTPNDPAARPHLAHEQELLGYERAYQQDLANRKRDQAIFRAKILTEAHDARTPRDKFNLLIGYAAQSADKADFQEGIRTLNLAMADKPADLPISDEVRQLQSTLIAQNQPVSIGIHADKDTYFMIPGFRSFNFGANYGLEIPPGNYEVVGRRQGYQDVVIPLQIRSGESPPTINVACTVPVQE